MDAVDIILGKEISRQAYQTGLSAPQCVIDVYCFPKKEKEKISWSYFYRLFCCLMDITPI